MKESRKLSARSLRQLVHAHVVVAATRGKRIAVSEPGLIVGERGKQSRAKPEIHTGLVACAALAWRATIYSAVAAMPMAAAVLAVETVTAAAVAAVAVARKVGRLVPTSSTDGPTGLGSPSSRCWRPSSRIACCCCCR
jgi:hypothetical protein